MTLPSFRYHPDPIGSGSIAESGAICKSCGQAPGYIYTASVYSVEELDDALCPWCIADGSAHKKFDASFVDERAFAEGVPESAIAEISQRTPGYSSWQTEFWPGCCGDASAFLTPAGIAAIRQRQLEGVVMNYIVYEMEISGGAANHLLNSLDRDGGPTAYIFQCLHCSQYQVHIDHH